MCRQSTTTRQLKHFRSQFAQNISRPSLGAHDNFPTSTLGDDKCRLLIIKGETVGIGAHGLDRLAILRRLANIGIVVFADTAIFICPCGRTSAVAWSKGRPLNVVIRIGVDAISGMSRRESKIQPWTLSANALVGLF